MRFYCIPIFILILFSAGCRVHTGSGKLVSKTIEGENFNSIDISGPYEVEIVKGTICSVVVETDDNLMKIADVTVKNNKLVAEVRGSNFRNAHLKLIITAPEIQSIEGSAAAEFTSDDLTATKKLEISLSSSSSFKGKADAPEIHLKASSAGNINIKGRTRLLFANASSSGDIEADQLLSETTSVSASSGADISVYASIQLNATASSGADIRYTGNGNVQKHTSSGGKIEKL